MSSKYLAQFFESLKSLTVLVIGDAMVDAYLFGDVGRISPEAPVPIVDINNREMRLGGAANVLLNLKALGATPILASVIGDGIAGTHFHSLLEEEGLSTDGIITSSKRITTQKTRIISQEQQMIRVDEEDRMPLFDSEKQELFKRIKTILDKQEIDAVIFEDYDKGVISSELIDLVTEMCHQKKIPISVDPKKNNFLSYKNVTLFKPNLKELREGLGISLQEVNKETLDKACKQLEDKLGHSITLITLGPQGVYYNAGTESKIIPAHLRKISDVSGAGDTVISVASCCLALTTSFLVLAELANLSGGLVCEEVGVVPIQKDRLRDEALRLQLFS